MKVCPLCAELYPDDAGHCPADGTRLTTVLDPLIGRTIGGRYRLIERLGAGGMSSVYLARHVVIDRLIAIKTLRRELGDDPVQRDRFLREARAVNRINHEHIVEITDFGETQDGLVYLVMEYVPGEPLSTLMDEGPMPVQRALDVTEQCAAALGRAHQMGVIHRDLKPDNILVVQRDERDYVKLLDFGIAKILDAPSLTGSQQIFGTPGYIAPEYIQAAGIDARADLYSLGCILYEMVTGALPFDYKYPGDLLVKHITEPPVPPRERLQNVPVAVEDFILRALRKDPDERFRDAFHFNSELARVRERLGPPSSWGPLNEKTQPEVIMPAVAVLPGPTEMEAPRDTFVDPKILGEGLLRTLAEAMAAEEPTTEMPSRPEQLETRELVAPDEAERPTRELHRVPVAPGLDRDALRNARRWRERFDSIRTHLDEFERAKVVPVPVASAMAEASAQLEVLEDAVQKAKGWEEALSHLEAQARDFRTTLGRAMDQGASQLSEQRGRFEALVAQRNRLRERREGLRGMVRQGKATEGEADAVLWELASVEEGLRRAALICDEAEAQLGELTAELERNNEHFDAQRGEIGRALEQEVIRSETSREGIHRPLEQVEHYLVESWQKSIPPAGRN